MTYEITKDFPIREVEINTPMGKTMGAKLDKDIVLVPILRAGLEWFMVFSN